MSASPTKVTDDSAIAFHWDRITHEMPELTVEEIITEVAHASECDDHDVIEFMERRLGEIEDRRRLVSTT